MHKKATVSRCPAEALLAADKRRVQRALRRKWGALSRGHSLRPCNAKVNCQYDAKYGILFVKFSNHLL